MYKWENCASFYVHASGSLGCRFTDSQKNRFSPFITNSLHPKRFAKGATDSLWPVPFPTEKINVPAAYDYLSRFRNVTEPGSGIMIAVSMPGSGLIMLFSYLRERGKIKAAWDFVDNDSTVYDRIS